MPACAEVSPACLEALQKQLLALPVHSGTSLWAWLRAGRSHPQVGSPSQHVQRSKPGFKACVSNDMAGLLLSALQAL